MNVEIQYASTKELKRYICSQIRRCVADWLYFSLFEPDSDSERTEAYAVTVVNQPVGDSQPHHITQPMRVLIPVGYPELPPIFRSAG